MPWNAGVFDRLYSWASDKLAGIKIRADRMDAEFDNVKSGLENCVTRDGQNLPSADLPMGGFKHTGVAAGSASDEYATYGQLTGQIAPESVTTSTGAVYAKTFVKADDGLQLLDGMPPPDTDVAYATIYIDEGDGDLKIKFSDGTVKTISVDT